MRPTQKQLALKLKQVEKFEKDWGECTRSRAMRKYCTDKKYRERVHAFNQSVINIMSNLNVYGVNNTLNENNYYEF